MLDEAGLGPCRVLTGFSQFSPVDGVPAADSTEVLVWYSPTAIHFGIRAYEAHGAVHATLADRDKIGSRRSHPDPARHLQRRAPGDRVRRESASACSPTGRWWRPGRRESGNGFSNAVVRRETADLSPDYVYRLEGPGHRLRLRGRGPDPVQEPALPVGGGAELGTQRHPPGAAFRLRGLLGAGAPGERLVPGAVGPSGRDSPTCAAGWCSTSLLRSPRAPSGSARTTAPGTTAAASPELGGTVRWGITNNLSLNGTANPDFSQVESDAGQLLFDPRDEQSSPGEAAVLPRRHRAVHHAQQPDLHPADRAAERGGQADRERLRLPTSQSLSAMDDREVSSTGEDHPFFNILRLQRDMGSSSRVGVVYTDRIEGGDYNRVAGADARLVFGGDLRAAAPAGGKHDPQRRGNDLRSALAGALQPERPDARLPGLDPGER